MTRIIVLVSVLFFYVYLSEQAYFLKQDYIDSINDAATTWKAGANFDPDTPEEVIIKLLGSKDAEDDGAHILTDGPYKTGDPAYIATNPTASKVFDARIRWRRCHTIGAVRDQGNCGSCWAFGTTGAFADRLCIATDGRFNRLLSAEQLAFCCKECGNGCHGGHPLRAWKYFKRHGVVTGGNYNTTDGCQPYGVPPCLHHQEGEGSCDDRPSEKNHRCAHECFGDETIDYAGDHRKTRDAYRLTFAAIQKDVETYGPIAASFHVYDDFVNYKSGVYQKTGNASSLGGHNVKLIGWGVERGVEYWLMVNSWGTGWGDDGTFKIRRGTNECNVDDSTTGGVPVV